MKSKLLDHDQLPGEDVDRQISGGILDPLPDNVLMVLRHLQGQIDALETRVEELEP